MTWRVANSLLKLREQWNALHPARNKSEDGTIGDERHQGTTSDHNPVNGVVHAIDLTHDPAHGADSYALAETLRENGDPRLKYVISNRRIWAPSISHNWRPYSGSNAHDRHVHVSVVGDKRADDTSPWNLDRNAPVAVPVPPKPPAPTSRFNSCLPLLLVHEGGNDDDPRDPGGRTSRGITQREYNTWRVTHHGLPVDVWHAPQDQVAAIYHQNYWDATACDHLAPGVDYCVFDYGVNSGIGRSAKVLQDCLKVTVDGQIGPLTLAAAAKADPATLINAMCNERLAYLQRLSTWATFGRGWSTRVREVRRDALAAVSK